MRTAAALLLLVAAKLVFHALYLPAFEGPDEPFHLARISGDRVSGAIAGAVRQHPCSADLRRATGCPPFGSRRAEFNVLRFGAAPQAAPIANYEAHQPPVYYALGGAWLDLFSWRADPVWQLLWMRIFSVFLVILGAALFRNPLLLLVLLVPGAAESLARCANDAGVFAWSAIAMSAIARKAPTYVLALIAFIGPLIKLTSIAVVAFVIVWTLLHRGRGHSAVIAIASALFLPLQWLRGYAWGGTVELNATKAAYHETVRHAVIGFARSAYTFVKTTFWLGEWSFFKAPLWLLVLFAAYIALVIACSRLLRAEWTAHAVGLAVAIIATSAFFISHRAFWGDWGGVGGWYAWGWFPWLAVAVDEAIEIQRKRVALIAGIALILIANAAWFASAHAIYG